MNKIVFVLCGRPTDGYVNFSSRIADFPRLINDYLLTSLRNLSFDDLSIEEVRKLPLKNL